LGLGQSDGASFLLGIVASLSWFDHNCTVNGGRVKGITVELWPSWVSRMTRGIAMLSPTHVNGVSKTMTIWAFISGCPFDSIRRTRATPFAEERVISCIHKGVGFSRRRQSELSFLLDNHGEDVVDNGERIHQKDLGTHNREAFVQTFKESDYEILLVVSFAKTWARRKGSVVIEFSQRVFNAV